jgi:uncharacterized membrane protein YgdD (TMEM256/DUF423 family)
MSNVFVALGAVAGLTGVAMAAAAAHAIAPAALPLVQSALQMQGWHALALLFCGLWVPRGGRLAVAAGIAFIVGMLLFCGTVYAIALGGVHVGLLAPTGGTILMLGWLLLGLSAWRARP